MKPQEIQNKIYEIRHQNVMLDFDLAETYEIETRVLKQAVRRNFERFAKEFMFELLEIRRSKTFRFYRTRCGNALKRIESKIAIEINFNHKSFCPYEPISAIT